LARALWLIWASRTLAGAHRGSEGTLKRQLFERNSRAFSTQVDSSPAFSVPRFLTVNRIHFSAKRSRTSCAKEAPVLPQYDASQKTT
jgi:hypothetical protein